MRLSKAVLEWNEDNWEYQLLKKFNLENNTYHNDISTRKQTQKKKNSQKRKETFREKRKIERNAKLTKKITQNKKAKGYKPTQKKVSFN